MKKISYNHGLLGNSFGQQQFQNHKKVSFPMNQDLTLQTDINGQTSSGILRVDDDAHKDTDLYQEASKFIEAFCDPSQQSLQTQNIISPRQKPNNNVFLNFLKNPTGNYRDHQRKHVSQNINRVPKNGYRNYPHNKGNKTMRYRMRQ